MTEEFKQYELPEVPKSPSIVDTPDGAVLRTGEFKSPNYVKNQAGWKIDATGNAEFNGGTLSSGGAGETRVRLNGSNQALEFVRTNDVVAMSILSEASNNILSIRDIDEVARFEFTIVSGNGDDLRLVQDGSRFLLEGNGILGWNSGVDGYIGRLSAGNLEVSTNWLPTADNSKSNGTAAMRWSDTRSVLINGADIGFENGWKFREWPAKKEDIGKSPEWMRENANLGIQLLDENEKLIAVFHKNGNIYCNGFKPLSELK